MVNANNKINLTIENKKPFEIVQEVNNEIPSYEEFLKTYENDGKVNYADLNGGEVGEVKGCGPCTSSNCTHSRSELQSQLREAEQRLEELQNQLSRASQNNIYYYRNEITVIRQNITIITGKISCLPGSFYVRLWAKELLNYEGMNGEVDSFGSDLNEWLRNLQFYSDRENHGSIDGNWDRSWFAGKWKSSYIAMNNISEARRVLRHVEEGWLSFTTGFMGGAGTHDSINSARTSITKKMKRLIERCENGENIHYPNGY